MKIISNIVYSLQQMNATIITHVIIQKMDDKI